MRSSRQFLLEAQSEVQLSLVYALELRRHPYVTLNTAEEPR
jgi:hypothetical protein